MLSRIRAAARRAYREFIPFLYGKTNYKLFMLRSFESLDRRVAATLAVTNVIPGHVKPVPIRAPFGPRMLVVAPHHDDEIIGCGGAMVLQRRAGQDVHVIFTQDGGDEHAADGRSREAQVALREAEAIKVTTDLGIAPPTFLRFQRLSGPELTQLSAALAAELRRIRPSAVFVPYFLDYNRHHQLTVFGLADALAASGVTTTVYGYEVWGLAVPNVVLNIDSVADEKYRLLNHYVSQLSGKDYTHGIRGLNMFHSLHFGAGDCRFAERFFEMPSADFIKAVAAIRRAVAREGDGAPLDY